MYGIHTKLYTDRRPRLDNILFNSISHFLKKKIEFGNCFLLGSSEIIQINYYYIGL